MSRGHSNEEFHGRQLKRSFDLEAGEMDGGQLMEPSISVLFAPELLSYSFSEHVLAGHNFSRGEIEFFHCSPCNMSDFSIFERTTCWRASGFPRVTDGFVSIAPLPSRSEREPFIGQVRKRGKEMNGTSRC